MLFSSLLVLGVVGTYVSAPSFAFADDLPTTASITICGDGLISVGEICDGGTLNNTGTYGSSTSARMCSPGCLAFGPYCGDGILQVRFQEECDDGNNTSGDLCSAICKSEAPVPPASSGSPTRGGTPPIPGATPGAIPSITSTKVVLRGKAYPNADVSILLDGKKITTAHADANADFLYSTTDITPGVATFGFIGTDIRGTDSITTAVVFDVVQSAVTTVANIFLPPTISPNKTQVAPGEFLTLEGQSIPNAKIRTDIFGGNKTVLNADSDATGLWALQVDTKSLSKGFHTAKSLFEFTTDIKSGYGRSISFYVGNESPSGNASPDINHDGKVNLVDFSIFLLSWNTADPKTDFNGDGTANLADFSIMLFAWTG